MADPNKPLWRADLALAGITLIWGATFVVVKQALQDVSPILFLALRFALATLALALAFGRRWSFPSRRGPALRAGALAGLFLFAGYAFQTLGLRLTTAPKSAFLTGLSTVMVPLLAALVYQSRPRRWELAGVGCATLGMGLMTLPGVELSMSRGDLLTIFCAVAFAAHIVTVGHYSKEVGFELLASLQVAVSAVLAASLFGWVETPRIHWSAQVLAAIAVTGLLATALAFSVQTWAQRYTTSTRTALIFALEPVFAWLTSFLLSGETLAARAAAGAGLILGGVILVEMKPFSPQQHPSN